MKLIITSLLIAIEVCWIGIIRAIIMDFPWEQFNIFNDGRRKSENCHIYESNCESKEIQKKCHKSSLLWRKGDVG
jgi:hypothetical protein